MPFIAMDLLCKYPETENGTHYALTIICMLTSFVSIIPIKEKKTETMINAYIKYIYADKGGSKFILSDSRKEFLSASISYIADHLGLTKSTPNLTNHILILWLRDITVSLKTQ